MLAPVSVADLWARKIKPLNSRIACAIHTLHVEGRELARVRAL